jgi:hypothetical protein
MNKEDENEELYQKPPSAFQMVKNFSKELTKYVKAGAPNVTPESYAKRLDACSKCPHLKEKHMRCGLCGCMLEHKAKWRTSSCPDSPQRWDIENNPGE